MVSKGLSRIASHFLVLLLAAVLVVLPSVPVRAQGAGEAVTISMVPVGIKGEISGTVSLRIPTGYELDEAGQDDVSWGEERVSPKHYTYRGTKVFSVIIFADGCQCSDLGKQADGIDLGGGILFIRGPVDIQAEAEQYLRPHVKGTIYEEGTITVPGEGASYPAYYYLSTCAEKHTTILSQTGEEIEYQWTSVHHHLQVRVALSQSQPLYTMTLWASTWGLPGGIHSDGSRRTYTIDGKPQFVRHKEYLKNILASVTISGWKAPSSAPVTTPAPTPVAAPTLDQSQTSIPGNTGLEGDWWLSQGFIPSRSTLTSVEVYVGSVHANLSYPLTLQVRADSNELPFGRVLASISVTITKKGWGWITFDIPDLRVNPGTKYHLVLESKTNYHVGLDSTNPYSYGSMGYSTDAGANWKLLHDNQNYDMAFKIYGTGQPVATLLTAVPTPPGRIETMVQPLIQLVEESPHPQLLETNDKASLSALRRNLENLKWAGEQHEYYQRQPTRDRLEAQARGYNVAFWRQVISNLVKTTYKQLDTLEGFLDSARSIGAPVDYELDSQWQEARGTLDIARGRYDIGMPAPELEKVPVKQILVELEEVPVQVSFLSQRHNSLVTNINRLNEDRVQLYQSQQELLPTFTEQAKVARGQSQRLSTEYERWGKEVEEDRRAFVGNLRDFAIGKLIPIPGAPIAREVLARTGSAQPQSS